MTNYPEIEIDKENGRVISHQEDGSYSVVQSVEAVILAKILFELEKVAMTLEELNGKVR